MNPMRIVSLTEKEKLEGGLGSEVKTMSSAGYLLSQVEGELMEGNVPMKAWTVQQCRSESIHVEQGEGQRLEWISSLGKTVKRKGQKVETKPEEMPRAVSQKI